MFLTNSFSSILTEVYNRRAFHSNASLGIPRKEKGIKRVCNSEQLIKPRMSFFKSFRFKVSLPLEEKSILNS